MHGKNGTGVLQRGSEVQSRKKNSNVFLNCFIIGLFVLFCMKKLIYSFIIQPQGKKNVARQSVKNV